jgi:hypothetical protein
LLAELARHRHDAGVTAPMEFSINLHTFREADWNEVVALASRL